MARIELLIHGILLRNIGDNILIKDKLIRLGFVVFITALLHGVLLADLLIFLLVQYRFFVFGIDLCN